jgi:hypothetical protein
MMTTQMPRARSKKMGDTDPMGTMVTPHSGTHRDDEDRHVDDRDAMGICIEPPSYVCGVNSFDQYILRTQPELARVNSWLVSAHQRAWAQGTETSCS